MKPSHELPGAKLPPDAAGLVDAYFMRVRSALPVDAREECEETVENLLTHVWDELLASGASADVTRVLAAFGSPEALAAQCADATRDEISSAAEPRSERSPLSGRVLGVPFELRLPTAERVGARWWDPLNPRIFVPRIFGIGWTVNFASVAIKLGLVRPDDEDVPFGLVPRRWLALALAVPLVLASALAILVAVFQPALPAVVPVHIAVSGAADRFAPKETAFILPVVMTLLGAALALWPWLIRRRLPRLCVAAGALATMLVVISLGAYGQEVAAAKGGNGLAILFAGLSAALVLPFTLLVVLSRIGRAAEQKRDLANTQKRGDM